MCSYRLMNLAILLERFEDICDSNIEEVDAITYIQKFSLKFELHIWRKDRIINKRLKES